MGKISSSRPDLVLIDEQINDDSDGIDAGTKIIEMFQIPVLYLSSSSNMTDRHVRRDRYSHYLHKPFDAAQVSSSVKKILSRTRK
jgi:two-component system response regulator LytT